jgi:tRNA A37 methylthiotransferase MiaB
MNVTTLPKPPRVGLVSLGCPKALVDSERIMTKLRADGYDMSPDYAGADVVLVNTCGFLDSAKEESLEAIGEAIAENGRVVVTGCMGKDRPRIDPLRGLSGRGGGRACDQSQRSRRRNQFSDCAHVSHSSQRSAQAPSAPYRRTPVGEQRRATP